MEISSHFFFSWDCIRKVHGLKFHVVCSELIHNNYWLLWKRWKSNCFLCCFAFQHILNVFCGAKNQRETLIIFLGCLFFFLKLWTDWKTMSIYQTKYSSVKQDSPSKSYFFSLCDWRKRTSEKQFAQTNKQKSACLKGRVQNLKFRFCVISSKTFERCLKQSCFSDRYVFSRCKGLQN